MNWVNVSVIVAVLAVLHQVIETYFFWIFGLAFLLVLVLLVHEVGNAPNFAPWFRRGRHPTPARKRPPKPPPDK